MVVPHILCYGDWKSVDYLAPKRHQKKHIESRRDKQIAPEQHMDEIDSTTDVPKRDYCKA